MKATELTSGDYTVTETLPANTAAGSWALTSAVCRGEDIPVNGLSAVVTLAAGDAVDCTFINTFTQNPKSILSVDKVTRGGIGGPFPFTVADGEGAQVAAGSAMTTTEGAPVTAVSDTELPAGDYTVTEELPTDTAAGSWALTSAVCGGEELSVDGSSAVVTVDVGAEVNCIFTNTLIPTSTTTPTPTVTPTPTSPAPPPTTPPAPGETGLAFTGTSGLTGLLGLAALLIFGGAYLVREGRAREH